LYTNISKSPGLLPKPVTWLRVPSTTGSAEDVLLAEDADDDVLLEDDEDPPEDEEPPPDPPQAANTSNETVTTDVTKRFPAVIKSPLFSAVIGKHTGGKVCRS